MGEGSRMNLAFAATRGLWRPLANPALSVVAPRRPRCCYKWTRGVARVRINRFTGVKAVKRHPPKTDWQLSAEKEFLAMRAQMRNEEGYTWGMTKDDVRNLSPDMQHCLTLKCASQQELSKHRKALLIRKFQRGPLDTNSKAPAIATLTEKILNLRAHLLRMPKSASPKKVMSIRLSRRNRLMKALYKSDYKLYKHVCEAVGIRCIRFAIPDSKDPSKRNNPQAVDGDRARWLIRQRMYRARFRPREMRVPESNRLVRYTRHPMEPVPESWGRPQAVSQQVSRAWPYGVRTERVEGKQIVYNPTAPGKGFQPASSGRNAGAGPTPVFAGERVRKVKESTDSLR